MNPDEANGYRVLILAPTGRDSALAAEVLERASVHAVRCRDVAELCRELDQGAGALVLAEEAGPADVGPLSDWLQRQEAWSDLPVLLLTRPGADSTTVTRAMDALQNITVLERPLRVPALISTVRSALRARRRQYQLRAQLVELQTAEAALRAGDDRKNEFLAVLAHELRNPLAPVRNAILIIRKLAADDRRITEVTEMMERQVTHLVRLVDDLLEVSRIERGKIELRTEPIELPDVLNAAIEACRPLIDSQGHQLRVEIAPDIAPLVADFTRLTQVFANLLNNAAKYTDPGGEILLNARRDGGTAVVSVRDTGIGLAPDVLPLVFDMFVQGDHDMARSQGGVGIGLTLARSLVEMHGGSISASSNGVAQGSEFVVRLPIAKLPADAVVHAPPPAQPLLANARVLIVDDNCDAADSLGALLETRHASVRVVYSGQQTLMVLPKFRPTVMVVDIGMPDMDGYAIAQHVRQHPEFRDIHLIALTGWGQESDRLRTRAAGFDHHLTKPADVAALEALLAGGAKHS